MNDDLELEKEKALALSIDIGEEEEAAQEPASTRMPDLSLEGTIFQPPVGSDLHTIKMAATEGAVPFLKDATALVNAAMDGDVTSESYNKHFNELNEEINIAEEANPTLFTGSEIGSGMLIAPGMSIAKNATRLGKLINTSKNITKTALYSGASALSRSEDRSLFDFAAGAGIGTGGYVLGAAGQLLLSPVVKKANQIAEWFGAKATATYKNAIAQNANLAKLNEHIDKWFTGATKHDRSKAYIDYLQQFDAINENDTAETVADKFIMLREEAGKELGALVKEYDRPLTKAELKGLYDRVKADLGIDERLGEYATLPDFEIDRLIAAGEIKLNAVQETAYAMRRSLDAKLKRSVDVKLETIPEFHHDPVTNILTKYEKSVITSAKEDFADLGFAELVELKRITAKKAKFNDTTVRYDDAAVAESLVNTISNTIDEFAEGSGLRAANKKWAIMDNAAKMTTANLRKIDEGIVSVLKDALSVRNVMLAGSAGAVVYGSGKGDDSAVLGGGIAFSLASLISATKNPNVHPKMAARLDKIAKFMSVNPESKIIQKLMVSAGLSNEEFREALAGTAAKISLLSEPISRSAESVKMNSDEVMAILRMENPEAAKRMAEALEADDDDTIGSIMDALSKTPMARNILEAGIGWNGKVYSQEDRQMLMDQIDTSGLSLKERLTHKKGVREQGIIPNITPPGMTMPDRYIEMYRRNQGRDKSKPNY